jgi:hypothetical protein
MEFKTDLRTEAFVKFERKINFKEMSTNAID